MMKYIKESGFIGSVISEFGVTDVDDFKELYLDDLNVNTICIDDLPKTVPVATPALIPKLNAKRLLEYVLDDSDCWLESYSSVVEVFRTGQFAIDELQKVLDSWREIYKVSTAFIESSEEAVLLEWSGILDGRTSE